MGFDKQVVFRVFGEKFTASPGVTAYRWQAVGSSGNFSWAVCSSRSCPVRCLRRWPALLFHPFQHRLEFLRVIHEAFALTEGLSEGVLAGISVGVVALIGIVGVFFLIRGNKRRAKIAAEQVWHTTIIVQ